MKSVDKPINVDLHNQDMNVLQALVEAITDLDNTTFNNLLNGVLIKNNKQQPLEHPVLVIRVTTPKVDLTETQYQQLEDLMTDLQTDISDIIGGIDNHTLNYTILKH